MPRAEVRWLRDWLDDTADNSGRFLLGRHAQVAIGALRLGSSLDLDLSALQGRSVLIATQDQLTSALALIELDGVARRITLVPPDVPRAQLPLVMDDARIDALLGEGDTFPELDVALRITSRPQIRPTGPIRLVPRATEWVLFTSGTTGVPKLVVHTLAGLTGAIRRGEARGSGAVWGTFYDIRRYGGLQIFLRAIHDGGSLVLSDAHEPVGEFLARLGRHGATHVSGTPSHWRRALMSGAAGAMSPLYVRLSGEIADQAILDALAACYDNARIGHAYASTEAGVGFDVNDGREGFPAELVGAAGEVELKVVDGSLRIRSPRAATRYLGAGATPLTDADGFVDTGDMVALSGERYYFAGRKGGIINVGGLKVHPEEVEGVINRHPRVRMSRVQPRKSPITGAVVVAEVVLCEAAEVDDDAAVVRGEILDLCRTHLAQHKVPAVIRFVPALSVAPSGKLERRHA
ncbi:MAG TPA: fatty acid--CoA ligase family protein [Xanthobacteraceae bacterium]|nr:fatty acid--CoA ligase family protein [Xanthobacteraceae bacterium]